MMILKKLSQIPPNIAAKKPVMSDLNTDVSKDSALTKKLEGFVRTFDLQQVVNEYTHLTDSSVTITDKTMVSDDDKVELLIKNSW